MEKLLREKIEEFLLENYPDVLHLWKGDFKISGFSSFIDDQVERLKPLLEKLSGEGDDSDLIIEICLKDLAVSIGPSKSNYVTTILKEEFPTEFEAINSEHVLQYAIINMVSRCNSTFEDFEFSEANKDSRFLRHAVIARIHDYLHNDPD